MSEIRPAALNLSARLVERLMRIRRDGLSEETAHQAKRCLLDYLGAAYAGAEMIRDRASVLLDIDLNNLSGVSAIGFNQKVGLKTAAFVNGLCSHVAEMDDGVRHGMIHPGSPIVSAILPAAQRFMVSGNDLLMGIVVGYEAALRLATSIQPSHYRRGYHPTATCGSIGAAMGLAAMLGLDEKASTSALAAAAVTASGSLMVIGTGSELKPYNTAHAALSGLSAYLVATAGFPGPVDALSGETGFLQMCADSCDVSKIVEDRQDGLWIHQVYVKPYAACRHAHPAIEACLNLRDDPMLSPETVDTIRVTTYGGLAGRHDHRTASTVSEAKMSIPVSAAIAFVAGKAGVEQFSDDTLRERPIVELAKRVTVSEDPMLTALVPHKRQAHVEITTFKGYARQATVTYPKGEPESPMSDEEISHKFFELAWFGCIDRSRAIRIRDRVFNLPSGFPEFYAEY